MSCSLTEYTLKDIIWIASENENDSDSLITISEEEAFQNSEEILQLKEGCSYEYELQNKDSRLEPISGIIHESRRYSFRGRITPGNYVGRLPLKIISQSESVDLAIEVRSLKADYRNEYRKMLEYITYECADLLMIHSSPVTQRFSVDFGRDSETLYQRFSFVQAMVDTNSFKNAVLRVLSSPVTGWKVESENLDSRRVKRINSSHVRQFASGRDRIPFSDPHMLGGMITSIPRQLKTSIKTDTLDNPENRFIKHVLTEFARFSGFICQKIDESGNSVKPNVYYEAKNLEKKISVWLSHNKFREVSDLTVLPLNNPVLQRKEGYREIFKIWLMYDLAAKLTWSGLDKDTYHAGKRDVAALYEYWLFFKILHMVEDIFKIEPIQTKQLIKETLDGLGLQLKAGHHTVIEGLFLHKNRNLKIKYNYNRTFSYADYPESGSWTQSMRPDYTLSFWPADFSETEAEEQELIIHIHFDAKYKVDDLQYILRNHNTQNETLNTDELNEEKELEKSGRYKRADLLKMHAYKDAIRRTAGAYVLYPGSVNSKPYKGFHELVPGLGAFAVSPSAVEDGMTEVQKFILSVLDHFIDRTTQRETHSYYTHKIMKNSGGNSVHERLPEYTNVAGKKYRTKPVIETSVLIGYVQQKQKDWISAEGLYNIRMDNEITSAVAGADYLLLYDGFSGKRLTIWRNGLFKIKNNPIIRSKDWLNNKGYPEPSMNEYFVYEISPVIEDWSENKIVEISLEEKEEKYRPLTRNLSEVIH